MKYYVFGVCRQEKGVRESERGGLATRGLAYNRGSSSDLINVVGVDLSRLTGRYHTRLSVIGCLARRRWMDRGGEMI